MEESCCRFWGGLTILHNVQLPIHVEREREREGKRARRVLVHVVVGEDVGEGPIFFVFYAFVCS